MPILAGLFSSLFSGLFSFFVKFMSHKAAVVLATLLLNSGLVVTLFAAQLTAIGAIQSSVPQNQYFLIGLWLAIPDNGPAVISACLSFDVVMAIYRWNTERNRLMTIAAA